MDYPGIKRNGKQMFSPAVLRQRAAHWDKVKDGQHFISSLTIPNKGKSHAQCKLVFGNMIANAVEQANDKHITVEKMMQFLLNDALKQESNGVPIDKDFLHAFIYIISPTFSDDGKPITLSKMDTLQASRLFKVTQLFLARMGIVIDDPPEKENNND
jgi:hypothetical protein